MKFDKNGNFISEVVSDKKKDPRTGSNLLERRKK